MALSAFFLVATEDHDEETLKAGWLYLATSHFATLCVFVMFSLGYCVSHEFGFGGLAGALFSIYLGFISTDIVFSLNLDFLPLVASLLGGSGVFLGPLVGSFILSLADLNLPTFINRLFPSVTVGPLVVNGTILLVMGLFLPAGIVNASFLKRYSAARPDELILRRLRRTRPRNSLAPRSSSRSSGLPQ